MATSFIDVPDKIAYAIYFSGCSIRCKGCQNKELWEKTNGTKLTLHEVKKEIDEHPLAEAIVFLGGEPTDQKEFLQELCAQITNKQKVLYTGREFEALPDELTKHLDMIICGPYRSELHREGWPASSNQRVFTNCGSKKGNQWKLQQT